ncbi:Carotenoid oxygenase [Corchorus capsularis]|uniref:Carotenoid oxygenase n=1 Tax=Corchorus capsularis TaxID=210143 RepID=A0A1R3GV01_COCAP|nr:Carotenoid oxygenase [Corchorus capsularis]
MASSRLPVHVRCSVQKPNSISPNFDHFKATLSSAFKPFVREIQQLSLRLDHVDVSKAVNNASVKLLDAFFDSVFEFSDQPLLPSQSNFAPVDELKQAVQVTNIQGEIPDDFLEGVYIRNGPNPLFGGLKSTKSIFGRSNHIWIEGEGMLHALYFSRGHDGRWNVVYKNRHVETETFKLEKQRNKPSFLPAIEGDSPAILSAYLLNMLRFGKVNKQLSNTAVIEHAGKFYSVAENHEPQEINIITLETLHNWVLDGAWDKPFSSHPKKAPGTGELVIMGINATKPFVEVGVISADGKKLLHRADLKLNRCSLCHEIGVTERYNVFMDHPLCIDLNRLIRGGQLIEYEKEGDARIGVMPRYGDADSIQWFKVKPNCTFHLFNCFEDGDEVVMWGCRALNSVIPGPDQGNNKLDWFSKKFGPLKSTDGNVDGLSEDQLVFPRPYEWRMNMRTGEVKERNLTGIEHPMDFPMINETFVGLKNKYGYSQVRDCIASSTSGMAKYGGLAKLYFEEHNTEGEKQVEGLVKVEYHMFEDNTFCTGAAFVPKEGGADEDDGWLITFVHNEYTNISQALIIEAKNFSGEPVAEITLPFRVPYGFHGAFMPMSLQNEITTIIPSLNPQTLRS